MTDRTRNLLAGALLVVGLAQMAGDVLRIDALRGVAAATAASPAPKVFSVARGLETFSTRFVLEWRDSAGARHAMALTPEVYGRMRGPYKRRNVYGAVLAYGPVLPPELRDPVASYALSPPDAPLLRELGIEPARVTEVRVRYEPLPSTPADVPRELTVPPRTASGTHDAGRPTPSPGTPGEGGGEGDGERRESLDVPKSPSPYPLPENSRHSLRLRMR